ncbi:CDP-diacylglycerol--glycerol-3-phosphate 3-phosphatidyltransferase [Helicobacter anatolicus]|uniref:CDP-diacylglycerol--glycerol-3-phosphate 3-phosphatidyltransferase n=1 Tax=Helicobacter anatolicus TaxID=2905874 RepID=UPI001E457C9E|nr:CDP-diacylglycerol--glycerol-3-phosphate 3-phosphatidyltransferase [Helicobacter anatolicus]MCE3037867.1 CDP-diacylglycerol--glycerol-3-phosphate 3-phosphatidyltransferase [Helicobacter anatolicus]
MKNIPNILTISRILISVLVIFVLLNGEELGISNPNFIAFWLFIFASITDFFDGYLARKFNLTSIFGAVFDPLADKMLILAAFIGLLCVHKASPWAVFLIFSREFFITGLRVVVASNNQSVSAGILGKIKTILQIIAICFLLLDWYGQNVILWGATLITLYSGLDYAIRYYKNIK